MSARRPRSAVLSVGALMLVGVTSGCGLFADPLAGEPGGATATAASAEAERSAGPTDTKVAAQSEAQRLADLAVLPDGAVRLAAAPSALAAAGERPAVASLATVSRFYRVPQATAATLAWIKTHPPVGLLSSGGMTASSSAGAVSLEGLTFAEPSPDAARFGSATLQYVVAADGEQAAVLRIEAQVVWLDQTPQRDALPGARLRVTLAGGCPTAQGDAVGVRNPGAGDLDGLLVPHGSPSGGLVCRYAGANGTPVRGLLRSARLDAGAAARVAAALAGLRLAHPVGGVTNCPMDDGTAYVVVLSYPGRDDVDLWVEGSGCRSVSNGHLFASGDLTSLDAATAAG